jgi:hypothetical protein
MTVADFIGSRRTPGRGAFPSVILNLSKDQFPVTFAKPKEADPSTSSG